LTDFGKVLRKKHAITDALLSGTRGWPIASVKSHFPHEIKLFGSPDHRAGPAFLASRVAVRAKKPEKQKRTSLPQSGGLAEIDTTDSLHPRQAKAAVARSGDAAGRQF
jgi:hypothetical protein